MTISPHDEFVELCALATSGELTQEEQEKLEEHLAVCESCRQILQQYKTVIDRAIPAIAAYESTTDLESDSSWEEGKAEKEFVRRLERKGSGQSKKAKHRNKNFFPAQQLVPVSNESTWRDVWILYGAGILLFAGLSFYAYRVGVHRGTESAKLVTPAQPTGETQPTLEAQLSDAGHERQIARTQIEERDRLIADLRKQLALQIENVSGLKAEKEKLEDALRTGDTARQDLAQQRDDLSKKLDVAASNSQTLQQKLDSLSQQSA
ncbi:MAG TPA: zf-HC2 domain-containing protein, partial [Terriglobales bacterium]|nr:zf-HC2 domain-containing protein [Terriglobales bacterium]